MSETIAVVTVFFENRDPKEIELLNPISEIPKDLQRAGMGKAETQSYEYHNASEKPRPTHARVEELIDVEIDRGEN